MDEQIFADILHLVAGGVSLTVACGALGVTDLRLFWRYIREEDDDGPRRVAYLEARAAGSDAQFDEILDLENDVLSGRLEPTALNAVVNSRKWRLAKLKPLVYGDSIDVTSGGQALRSRDALSALSVDDLERFIDRLER